MVLHFRRRPHFPRGFPVGVVRSVRDAQPFKEILLDPVGLQHGLEDVLIITQGVHQDIPLTPSPTSQCTSRLRRRMNPNPPRPAPEPHQPRRRSPKQTSCAWNTRLPAKRRATSSVLERTANPTSAGSVQLYRRNPRRLPHAGCRASRRRAGRREPQTGHRRYHQDHRSHPPFQPGQRRADWEH